MDLNDLPEHFRAGFEALKKRCPEARVDAIKDNFVYIWLEPIYISPTEFKDPRPSGVWVRIPIQFPNAQPHGVITLHPLLRTDGRPLNGSAGRHEICGPVADRGGVNYYSWTWNGNLGQGPALLRPSDMAMVFEWVERRIRVA